MAGFSGSERTVAEFLLAEVLRRQPRQVRRLLLRTSILERVNGELADLLTGRSGGGRILQDLEQAGAFVVAVDAQRSWFRYHRLFADLLQFELRAADPDEVPGLHAVTLPPVSAAATRVLLIGEPSPLRSAVAQQLPGHAQRPSGGSPGTDPA